MVEKGRSSADLSVGESATFQKTISESDVYLFGGVTGDLNPAHVNEVYAEGTRFKKRIVHGMLSASLISGVMAMKLPGHGTIYLGQTLKFTAPVYIGDTIEAKVTVAEINVEKNIVKLDTTCTNQDGTVVVEGVATVMPPK